MRILLDESLPRSLAQELSGHEVQTVQSRGWAGLKNGELLRLATAEFQAFLTGDQNLEYQQNMGGLAIAVLVLVAVTIASNLFARLFRRYSKFLQLSSRDSSFVSVPSYDFCAEFQFCHRARF